MSEPQDTSTTADLLTELATIRVFLEMTVATNRLLLDVLREGYRPTAAQLSELAELQQAQEHQLARFLVRCDQLRAQQRLH